MSADKDLLDEPRPRKRKKRPARKSPKPPSYRKIWKAWHNSLWPRLPLLARPCRVRCVIDSLSYKGGTCSARPQEIARRAGVSVATVNKVIAEDVAKRRYRQDDKGTLHRTRWQACRSS
jgi:hypothetical protein